jgi:NADPH:quinone reductase-like Zn-dependent oxidoreductase
MFGPGQILYNHQGVALPPQKISGDKWVSLDSPFSVRLILGLTSRSTPQYLVYGGSTAVGLFAVQLAKLAGYKVVATASPKNFDLVKSYGADEVVDVSASNRSHRS